MFAARVPNLRAWNARVEHVCRLATTWLADEENVERQPELAQQIREQRDLTIKTSRSWGQEQGDGRLARYAPRGSDPVCLHCLSWIRSGDKYCRQCGALHPEPARPQRRGPSGSSVAEQWLVDPSGRHPDRWWDGSEWTMWVRDKPGGTRGRDQPVFDPPSPFAGERWLPDPSGRFPDRWWDGSEWTKWVRDKPGGTRSEDPPVFAPPQKQDNT
jgi:hypothetical protein